MAGGDREATVRVFFRIVLSNPPSLADFTSRAAQGTAPIDLDPERGRLHEGISVYATENQARRKAREYPFLGSFLARLELPEETPLHTEGTVRNSPGHHTLWGDPGDILRCVVVVVSV